MVVNRIGWELYHGGEFSIFFLPWAWAPWETLGIGGKIYQTLTAMTIRELISRDQKRNLAAWSQILSRLGEIDKLREAQKALENLTPTTRYVMCQRGVKWYGLLETGGQHATSFWESVALGIPGFDGGRLGFPVESLSLTFFQAETLKPILEDKIRVIALQCNGLLAVTDTHGPESPVSFIPAARALADPVLRQKIRWAPLKKMGRVRQKLHRCYKSDMSRLCDLCRETLVFSQAADLLKCLQLLGEDHEIAVIRTKSSMDPDGSPQHLSGFRQISINFTILSDRACKRGVSWHVCELQLLLLDFALLKSEDGHRRYVMLRDARGE